MGKAEEEMENKHSGLSWINRKPPRVQQLLGALRRLGDEEIYSLPNSNKVMPQSGMSIGVMPHFVVAGAPSLDASFYKEKIFNVY